MVRSKVIAIDGPAAAGKSTIAQKVAQMLGYIISIQVLCIEQ